MKRRVTHKRNRRYLQGKNRRQKQRQRRNRRRVSLAHYIKASLLLLFLVLFFMFNNLYRDQSVNAENARYAYIHPSYMLYLENYTTIKGGNPYVYMGEFLLENDYELRKFDITKVRTYTDNLTWYKKQQVSRRNHTSGQYIKALYNEVKVFPVPINMETKEYTYEDTYGAERTYGGNRQHLGTDIMDVDNKSGQLPILSMTDGYVRYIGWNELGGWRVTIMTPGGHYFYYAHLDRYVDQIQEGDFVRAGDCLGYMGNTGYGEVNTRGKFPVHLHLGIMIDGFTDSELWVNPYYVLKYIETKQKNRWEQR